MSTSPGMRERARTLRKHATKEENTLWYQYLHSLTPQWRRQMVIGGYILDFYCRKLKLAIELDGAQHNSPDAMKYDVERTKILNGMGIEVIRFSNSDIHYRFRYVCDAIAAVIARRTQSLPPAENGAAQP